MYIDTCTFIADRLFHDANVKVSKLNIFHKPGEDYRIVLAKCRKKDFPMVEEALELLPSNALVCGWFGYLTYADNLLTSMREPGDVNGTEGGK